MKLVVHIYKKFQNFTLNINFESENKKIAFLGSSGSGKSLTLKCIAGIIKPDKGYIEVNGKVLFDSEKKINLSPQERKVGYLFQNYALFPNMSVRKNILAGLSRNKSKEEKAKIVEEYLLKFELKDVENLLPNQISGGQQQRAALARILVSDPEILLLDEPFSALDSHLRNKLQIECKEIISNFNGQSILVSHDRDEAYLLSEEIALVNKGEVVLFKNSKELFKNPECYIGAMLTGCKNISRLEKGKATDWGIDIPQVPGISYIGIRAHNFSDESGDYSFPITLVGVDEEPFEKTIRFKFVSENKHTSVIYWKVKPQKKVDVNLSKIYFNEEDILYLK